MCPAMRDARLEAVACIRSHSRASLLCQSGNLSPEPIVCEVVSAIPSSLPQKLALSTSQNLLMAGPRLESAALQPSNLQPEIRIRQYRSVESRTVCTSRPRAQTRIRGQSLRSTKDVPQHSIHIRASLCTARFSSRLDGVSAPLFRADEDCMICRCGARIRRLRAVDVR